MFTSWQIAKPIRTIKNLLKKIKNKFLPFPETVSLPITFKNNLFNQNSLDLKIPLNFTQKDTVLVSIIIPVYNNIHYTYACLKSICNISSKYDYEIIVVDDQSSDNTQEILSNINGIRVIRNNENLGFINSCNTAARVAKGKYLLFLNNDTQVLPGWLDELVETFFLFPKTGLVGSKLIYPNNRLQEAGCIIWKDASIWNYGRNNDPDKPEYNYLRQVDYCSGASIMVPKDLFFSLDGFDVQYLPAYCEDSDLAQKIVRAGYKVLYQPLSQVFHFEGITSGTDLKKGVKKYQVTNQEKFNNRWKPSFNQRRPNGTFPELERDRNITKRVLVVDAYTPTAYQNAQSNAVFFYIKTLIDLDFKVTFIPIDNYLYMEKYTPNLQRLGVECLYAPYVTNIENYLRDFGVYYNFVMIHRASYANSCISAIQHHCPLAKVIFNTTELEYLKLEQRANLENSPALATSAKELKTIEYNLMRNAHCTIVVSEFEKEIIAREDMSINISLIPLDDIAKQKIADMLTRLN